MTRNTLMEPHELSHLSPNLPLFDFASPCISLVATFNRFRGHMLLYTSSETCDTYTLYYLTLLLHSRLRIAWLGGTH